MKGIINNNFEFVCITDTESEKLSASFVKDDVFGFYEGDEVDILKTIVDDCGFMSGKAYVIYSQKTHESTTVDAMFLDVI